MRTCAFQIGKLQPKAANDASESDQTAQPPLELPSVERLNDARIQYVDSSILCDKF